MSTKIDEKDILDETDDLENQRKILREEHEKNVSIKKWYRSMGLILFFVILIITATFTLLSTYVSYDKDLLHGNFSKHPVSEDVCANVNLKSDGSLIPNLNITVGDGCRPVYNIDYFNNRKALFNIDVYGDKSFIFNEIDQFDDSGKCLINCDGNDDGWPDFNIDLNGDKKVDLNLSSDNQKCDLNCDINFDMLPDINVDINGDGKAEINIDTNGDMIPDLSIDYKGSKVAVFNLDKNSDGKADTNLINVLNSYNVCTTNCDINGDGFPDYNIDLGDGFLINELVEVGKKKTTFTFGFKADWKCDILKECSRDSITTNNKYINIDANGDGIVDINISNDNGVTLSNPLNKKSGTIILNEDINNDGFPDHNIDLDGDEKADYNITDLSGICYKNCDSNGNGKADYLINKKGVYALYNINIDKDYDGICDLNCDTNNDLIPDTNLDINDDMIPDENILNSDTLSNTKVKDSIDFKIGTSEGNKNFYVNVPLDINLKNIKSGNNYVYEMNVINNSASGIKYKIVFSNINTDFANNAFVYTMLRDNSKFKENVAVPLKESVLADNLVLAGNSKVKYLLILNYNLFPDDGIKHSFKATLNLEIIK